MAGDPGNPRRFPRSPKWKKAMAGFFHGQRASRMRWPSTRETLGVSRGRPSGKRSWMTFSTDSEKVGATQPRGGALRASRISGPADPTACRRTGACRWCRRCRQAAASAARTVAVGRADGRWQTSVGRRRLGESSLGSRSGGMADAADSKSVARKGVWVQVPPPALEKQGFSRPRESGGSRGQSPKPKLKPKFRVWGTDWHPDGIGFGSIYRKVIHWIACPWDPSRPDLTRGNQKGWGDASKHRPSQNE
jgi:hypothetical protein